MNYTRKRALLACDFCRHRKRRCDGERPCSTCKESNADCRYKDLPTERVESPSTSTEAVVERLGRIEALLEEQGQQLNHLFIHGTASSSFDGSHTSISPKISIDATVAGADSSEAADSAILTSHASRGRPAGSQLPRLSFHLAPEFPPVTTASLGGLTAAGTPGSIVASPPPSIASPIVVSPLLGIGASHQHLMFQQHHQQQLPFFHKSAPLPYHGTGTATSAPSFGLSAGAYPPTSGSGLTPGGPRSFLSGKASSVSNSDVSSHNIEHGQFLIPHEHSTAANTLLSLPQVRFFLEYHQQSISKKSEREESTENPPPNFSYVRTYFFDLETSLPLPPELNDSYGAGLASTVVPSSFIAMSHPAMLDGLVLSYFAHVHPGAPLFSIAQFRQWSFRACQNKSNESIETAICLVVWALGSLAASTPHNSTSTSPKSSGSPIHQQQQRQQQQQQAERDRFALSLFQPAMKIIVHHALWEFGPASLVTCQALLLAASYFSHIGRPLHNARMVYLASTLLIRVIEEKQRRDGPDTELSGPLLSVFWVCFIWECDRAAELAVPRSGIEPLADHMPLPTSLDPDDGDNMICFVAEIAARRLLNRIHNSLYATEGTDFGQGVGKITDSDSAPSGRTTPGHKRKRGENEVIPAAAASAVSTSGPVAGFASVTGTPGADNSCVGKMLPISAELNRQLEVWYHAMPNNIRPPLTSTRRSSAGDAAFAIDPIDISENVPQWHDTQQQHPTRTLSERVEILRIHYYAARHIIHRPFVLAVAWQYQQQILACENAEFVRNNDDKSKSTEATAGLQRSKSVAALAALASPSVPPLPLSADVLGKCAICVDSCVSYLVHVLPLLERRSPYLWSFCQSSMACLLVLLVADACPGIASSMSNTRHGNAGRLNIGFFRDEVAARLRQWATPGSSFEAELKIIESFPVKST